MTVVLSVWVIGLYIDVSYMKVKLMYNLLKLLYQYSIWNKQKNFLHVFTFLKKESVRQIRVTELLK